MPSSAAAAARTPLCFRNVSSICSSVAFAATTASPFASYLDAEFLSAFVGALVIAYRRPFQVSVNEPVLFLVRERTVAAFGIGVALYSVPDAVVHLDDRYILASSSRLATRPGRTFPAAFVHFMNSDAAPQ